MNQESRVVLITGASSGIGRACASYLASRRFRVYGTSRKIQGEERIVDCGSSSYSLIPMDVNDETSVQRGVDWILAREGRLDVVVNNAGCGISGSGLWNTSRTMPMRSTQRFRRPVSLLPRAGWRRAGRGFR